MNAIQYDKIRILWIDDREAGTAAHPEDVLTDELSKWFTITHHQKDEKAWSYISVADFVPHFEDFWFDDNRSVLPPDLIVMDYNLGKLTGLKESKRSREELLAKAIRASQKAMMETESSDPRDESPSGETNHDGLLLGLICGALLHEHPMGLVPMTLYEHKMPESVTTLQEIVKPFLGVNFENVGIPADDRTWSKLVRSGVARLRDRICQLYEESSLVISFSDLTTLADNPDHEVLTIRSRFGKRRLPVRGLFIDVKDDRKREEAITKFANDLLKSLVPKEEYEDAVQLAEEVWTAYDNTRLVEERARLSSLLAPTDMFLQGVKDAWMDDTALQNVNKDTHSKIRDRLKNLKVLTTRINQYDENGNDRFGSVATEGTAALFSRMSEMFRTDHSSVAPDELAERICEIAHGSAIGLIPLDDLVELKNLFAAWAVPGNKDGGCGNDECRDIFSDKTKYSQLAVRWAAVLIIWKLLRRVLLATKRFEQLVRKRIGQECQVDDVISAAPPVLRPHDAYVALYPAPANPLVFPWHLGKNVNKDSTLASKLKYLNSPKAVTSGFGNLALVVEDVLNGDGWDPENNTYGLKPVERQVLKGLLLRDPDLREEDVQGQARSVLFGHGKEG